MNEILIEKLNNNEDTYILGERYVQEGVLVEAGAKIAAIESSKTVEDLYAKSGGYIHFFYSEGDEVRATEVLACLYDTKNEYDEQLTKAKETTNPGEVPYHITRKARIMADEYGITGEELSSLGVKLIKTADLEKVIGCRRIRSAKTVSLSKNQLKVADTVSTSHSEIPQAFMLQKVDCSSCSNYIRSYAERTGVVIGYGEVLIDILMKLASDFPIFFSEYHGGKEVSLPDETGIGITFDVGKGLYIPVIMKSEAATMDSIANKLFSYKLKALEGGFSGDELSGACISISLNPLDNLLFVMPIIPPGQVAMVSVASPVEELAMDGERIVRKQYLHVGLAYDHRVINGVGAMDFMQRVSKELTGYADGYE